MELLISPPVSIQGPLIAAPSPPMSLSSSPRKRAGISKGVKSRLLRALIVDDEPIARRVLREELETQTDIEIVGEADNGARALTAIEAHEPDVVFLDLQMP